MPEPADINLEELRRRARRRLVGAIVLALGVAVIVPMLLENDQKPLGEDVSVRIPPVDDAKRVSRLGDERPNDAGAVPAATSAPAKDARTAGTVPGAAAPAIPADGGRTSKYDMRVPDAPASAATAPGIASKAPADTAAAAAAPSAVAVAKPSAEATPAPPAVSGGARAAPAHPDGAKREEFAVQLAAFADDKGANALANRLKRAGYAAYTEPLKTSKGTLWRVRVGPFATRDAAAAARVKLKAEGHSGIVAAVR